MLIGIREDSLAIKIEELTIAETTFLQLHCLPTLTHLSVNKSLKEIIIKGSQADLFEVLYKISFNHDIELI